MAKINIKLDVRINPFDKEGKFLGCLFLCDGDCRFSEDVFGQEMKCQPESRDCPLNDYSTITIFRDKGLF